MKNNIYLTLRRWQFPLLLLLSVMPLLLIAVCINTPEALGALGVLFAVYAAAAGVCLLVPGKRRMPAAALCSGVFFLLSFLLLPIREQLSLLVLPAALTALLFFSLPLAARRYESDVPPAIYFMGVAIHFIVQFLHHYWALDGSESPYASISAALTASLIGYILLFLLSMNRISLDNASLARHRIPAGMRAVNTVMTLVFIGAALLLSVVPTIIQGITTAWKLLSESIVRLFVFLISLLPSESDPGFAPQGGTNDFILGSEGMPPPSAFAILIEKIATVLTIIIVVVGVVVLLRLLYRLIMRLIRHTAARLRAYMSAASSEYEDEITDTRESGAQREIRFLRRNAHAAARHDGTPVGRIRFSYARLMRRNPAWARSSTARENLPEEAAALYERARYSDHPLTGEDAARFAEQIRRL